MKKKQLFALLGALIIGVSTAACGNSGTTASSGGSTVKEESTQANDSAAEDKDTEANDGAVEEESTQANASTSAEAETAAASDNDSAQTDSTAASEFTPQDSILLDDGSVIEFPEAGVTFTLPESFKNTKGFLPSGGGEITPGDGVFCMYYNYVALNEDDYEDLLIKYRTDSDNAAKYEQFFNPRVLGLFSVYAIDGSRTAEDINEYLKKLNEERGVTSDKENLMEGAELIGSVGEYNFYFLNETQPDAEISEDDSFLGDTYTLTGFGEEYAALVEDVKNACPGLMTFSEPTGATETAEPGTGVSFETVDLEGQTVTGEELFSKNKVTMINIWGTFCGPCINEMPELEKLYAEISAEGCGIIGVVGDAAGPDDTAIIDEAKTILSDAGVTYPNILPWDGLDEQLPFDAYPTTYFVDSEGKVIGTPVVGADPESYSAKLQDALEETGK